MSTFIAMQMLYSIGNKVYYYYFSFYHFDLQGLIETVSPEGTFCDTVQVPSGAADMQLI